MVRGSCRHGVFSVCHSTYAALDMTLKLCWGSRIATVLDDYAQGVRFSESERLILRAHRLIR